ncbi:MAG: hypothetical protein ACI9XC_001224, partial [Gammaproteobacteria bacterium]
SATGLELIVAVGGATLTNSNAITTLAAAITGAFSFTETDGFVTDTVLATSDVTASTTITFNSGGGVTQAGANGELFGTGLELLGAGPYTLTQAGNDVNTIAINTTGAVTYRDTDDLTAGTVNTVGITTSNDNVSLQTGAALIIDDNVNTGTGNLTLNSATSITQNVTDTVVAGNLDYDAATTIGINASSNVSGTVNIDSTGVTTISAAGDITAGGAVSFGATNTGTLTTAGDIETTNDNVTFTRAVTLSGPVDIDTNTGAGNILFSQAVVTGGNNLALDAGAGGNITLAGALTGGGAVTVRDGAAESFQALTVTSLNILDANSVTFNQNVTAITSIDVDAQGGSINQTATSAVVAGTSLDYDALTTITISDSINTGATANIDSTGITTIAALGDITAGGAVTFGAAKTGTLTTAGDIDTTDDDITFNRAVTLGGNVDIDTVGTANGNITFVSTIATAGNNLNLDAGPEGDITLQDALSGGGILTVRDGDEQSYQALTVGTLDIQDATTFVNFNGNIAATSTIDVNAQSGSITQTAASAVTSGTNLDYDAGTTISINNAINVTGIVDIDSTGTTAIAAAGDIVAGGAVSFGAAKTGTLTTAGDIDTTNDNVTFTRAVTFSGPVDIDTNTGAGDILFSQTVVTGGNNLALDAGAGGNITLVGALTGRGDMTVRDGDIQNYQSLQLNSLNIQDATTSVAFNNGGDINTTLTVNSGGTIDGGAGTIDVPTINLDAVSGIGAITPIDFASLTAINADSTNGDIDINNAATSAATINSMTTGTGDIFYDQTGNQNLTLTSVTTTNGDITITNSVGTNADIFIANNGIVANGDVTLNAGGVVDDLEDDNDLITNIFGTTLNITAGENIGNPGHLDTNVSFLNLVASGNIRINNDGTVEIVGLNAGGFLELFNAGNVTQSGAILVSGTTSLDANNGNDITFTNAGNNFGGRVTVVNGNNVSLVDANTLNLRTVDVRGNFTTVATITDLIDNITAGGDINFGGNGTLRISNDTILLSNSNTINLSGTNVTSLNDAALQISTPLLANLIIANSSAANQIDGSVFSGFTGHLIIGGTIEPSTRPALAVGTELLIVTTDLLTIASGANLISSSDITLLASNITLEINSLISAGGVGGNGAQFAGDNDQVSLVAVGPANGGVSGTGNITGVSFPGTIEGAAILLVAADDIINANNLVIDAGGGNLQTVVGSGNTPTFGILNATPIDASDATNSFLNSLSVGTGLNLNNLTFVQAQTLILGNLIGLEQIAFIDVGLFEEDLTLFGTIGQGIALSLAQCEEIEGCAPDVTESELDELIVQLEGRITELERRLAEGAGDDQEQIERLLEGYQDELANFNNYRDELAEFYSTEDDFDDGFGDEFGEDFSTLEVRRLNTILETVQGRIEWLENLKSDADVRAGISESTGIVLTIEAIDEIIRATQQQIRFIERQIQQLLNGTQAALDSPFVAQRGDITMSRFPVYGNELYSYKDMMKGSGLSWY